MCPHCLFSIRPSSPRSPVSKHHHHDLTAAAFRTSSLTCFSFVCICNPSVTCPFISSILTSHINPLTSLLPLAIFSAPATDLIPGQLLAKPLSLLSSRDSCVTTESFTSTMQSWSGERKMKSKLLCLAYKLLFQPGPSLLSFLSHLCTHIFCFLRAPHWLPKAPGFPFLQDSTSMPPSYRKPSLTLPSLCQACLGTLPLWSHSTWPFPLTMLSWNGLFMPLWPWQVLSSKLHKDKHCMLFTVSTPGLSPMPTLLNSGNMYSDLIPWIYHNVKTQQVCINSNEYMEHSFG